MERYPELLRRLFENRGLKMSDDVEKFLYPDYERDLHDPFLMLGMDRAVERVLAAIRDNEKTVIYGDYDCDGIPGSVVLHDFFRKIGYDNFFVCIPHRFDEGYGFHSRAVSEFAKSGVDLIVTVDSGTTDREAVERANENNIDVIITDHHEPPGVLPSAFAVLNPKQTDDKYPFDGLSGAGVVYKLVQALISRGRFNIPVGWEEWLLDMVGISTIADMVPLVGENRALAHFGLRVLRKSPRPGILSLMRTARVKQEELNEDDIGFSIGPRLNAASRMDKPIHAFDLLATSHSGRAMDLANHLERMNNDRKYLITEVMDEAEHILSKKKIGPVVVVGSESWRPGLLGLAASRLVEKYHRPAFVWGTGSSEGAGVEMYKGSCRSDGTVNIVVLMQAVETGVLTDLGGHEGAGGFSFVKDMVHVVEEKIAKAYNKVEKKIKNGNEFNADAELSINDVNWENYAFIEMCGPYGIGNPKPVFKFTGVVPASTRVFGKEKNHFEAVFGKAQGGSVAAIKFFSPEIAEKIRPSVPCSFLAHIEKNSFVKVPALRLRIVSVL